MAKRIEEQAKKHEHSNLCYFVHRTCLLRAGVGHVDQMHATFFLMSCNTYRSARRYSLKVLRHALVLVHVVVEILERAVGVGLFHLGHVLIVGSVRLSVRLKNLDVVLHLCCKRGPKDKSVSTATNTNCVMPRDVDMLK